MGFLRLLSVMTNPKHLDAKIVRLFFTLPIIIKLKGWSRQNTVPLTSGLSVRALMIFN
jgi:hypothetical protein